MEWQPIERAPKDGTPLLLFSPDCLLGNTTGGLIWVSSGYRLPRGGWRGDCGMGPPSHWMLLPDPPQIEKSRSSCNGQITKTSE